MTKTKTRALLAVLGLVALCGTAIAHPGGVNAPSAALPPIVPDNEYLSPADVHARYAGPALEIVLQRLEHQPFAGQPPFFGPDGERHHFESEVRGDVTVNGMGPFPFVATGPVDTVAYARCPTCDTGLWQTEMLQMQLVGNTPLGPVMIRESPTRPSLGVTSIQDIGPPGPPGGPYHIDSFFDVFTELSIDGGATWIPNSAPNHFGPPGSTGSTRVILGGVPEPATFALVAIGLIGAAGVFGRRR
jgi:hypothetical protein